MPGPTLIQSAGTETSSVATSTLAFTSNVTAGSLLVAFTGNENQFNDVQAVSDNLNGNWNQAVNVVSTGAFEVIYGWYLANAKAGSTTVSVTSSSAGHVGIVIEEWNFSPVAIDTNGAASQSNVNTASVSTFQSTHFNQELVVAGTLINNGLSISAGAGYTLDSASSSAVIMAVEYATSTGPAVQTATFSFGASLASPVSVIFTFNNTGILTLPFSQTQFFVQDRLLIV